MKKLGRILSALCNKTKEALQPEPGPGIDSLCHVSDPAGAVAAGEKVIRALDGIEGALRSAKTWGNWDLLGGDLLSTAFKRSRLKDARRLVREAEPLLDRFRQKLAGPHPSPGPAPDIAPLFPSDFLLDDLVVEGIVQARIVRSLDRVRNLRTRTRAIVTDLEALETRRGGGSLER